jgi:hypothetical protein
MNPNRTEVRMAEQGELIRQACLRVIENHASGRIVEEDTLRWAQQYVERTECLERPLGNGEASA